ncbi:type II secretion system protein GspM [Hoeflea poritis]|uniref:Type II secretion system protein GspM n=1 Tax=Hoeflea poritis TaxID=2993659 RepID=A0ABT4VXT1_9HYPH|nr:type II secretion system protein GspM [Hoeflea poritis]MDA4848842.1 type II secretion system protein GspM [Hoeflea poritis]
MIWLLNSPRGLRRAVALGIVFGAICAAGFVAAGAFASLRHSNQSVIEKRELLGRLQSIANRLPEEIRNTALAEEAASDEFLSGESETVIRAGLQQQLKQTANAQHLNVISVGNAPDLGRDNLTYVGLQANVTGTIASLQKTLFALETAKPVLFVTKLTVRSTDQMALRAPVAEPVLVAQIRLYGALKPESEEAGK